MLVVGKKKEKNGLKARDGIRLHSQAILDEFSSHEKKMGKKGKEYQGIMYFGSSELSNPDF